jgi:ATP-dependent protease ClpP protease subunit
MTITAHNNNIWFTGDITESNAHYIIQELEKLEHPTLFLCSNGGSVQQGFLLFDYLQYRSQNKPVNIVGTGQVCSAATYMLFTDNPTFLYPHCMMMIHPMATSVDPALDTNNFKALTGKIDTLTEQLAAIYARKGLVGEAWQSKSCYYTAEEIVALNIARIWSNPVVTIGAKHEST